MIIQCTKTNNTFNRSALLVTMFASMIITHQRTSCCQLGLTPFLLCVSIPMEQSLSNKGRFTSKSPFAMSSQQQACSLMFPAEWSGLGASCSVRCVLVCRNGVPLKCGGVSCAPHRVQESETCHRSTDRQDIRLEWMEQQWCTSVDGVASLAIMFTCAHFTSPKDQACFCLGIASCFRVTVSCCVTLKLC